MKVASLQLLSIENGPGARVSLFVSGCRRHCPGCHNEQAWDFNYGEPYTQKHHDYIIDLLKQEEYAGLSILGGEPMEPENEPELIQLCKDIRKECPSEKTIILYSGYMYDEIKDRELLKHIDWLIDGPYIEQLRDITLEYRGSSNQSIIFFPRKEVITNPIPFKHAICDTESNNSQKIQTP